MSREPLTRGDPQRAVDDAFELSADERAVVFATARLSPGLVARGVAKERQALALIVGVFGTSCALIVGGATYAWVEGSAPGLVAAGVALVVGGGGGALLVFAVAYCLKRIRALRRGEVVFSSGPAARAVWAGKPPRFVVKVDEAGWLTVPRGAHEAMEDGARVTFARLPADHQAICASLG